MKYSNRPDLNKRSVKVKFSWDKKEVTLFICEGFIQNYSILNNLA